MGLLSLTSCESLGLGTSNKGIPTTNGVSAGVLTAISCAGWKPIYPSHEDGLTLETRNEILAHDENGLANGCWTKPVKPKAP